MANCLLYGTRRQFLSPWSGAPVAILAPACSGGVRHRQSQPRLVADYGPIPRCALVRFKRLGPGECAQCRTHITAIAHGARRPKFIMAAEPRSATVWLTAAAMKAALGPRLAKYAITLNSGLLYKWVPNDTTTEQAPATYPYPTVIGHTGGYSGRWLLVRFDDAGTDLVDGAENVLVYAGRQYTLPLATLTGNSTKSLMATGAAAGDVIRITRLDVEAFTMPIDDDASTTTIFTFPASESWFADFRFDGTNWSPRAFGQAP